MINQRNAYSELKATTIANIPREYWPGGNETSFPKEYQSPTAELFEQGLVHRTIDGKTLERKAQRDRKEMRESVI